MTQTFPMRTVLGAVVGFVATVGALQFVPHDPLAEMPKIALVEYPIEVLEDLSPQRAEDEVRVFVVGASVETGYPYGPGPIASYATQLEVGLRAVLPGKTITCRPVAKPALASPMLVGVVDEVLRYDPSLVFVCLGENEFSDRLFYGRELLPDGVVATIGDRATRSRLLFQALGRGFAGSETQQSEIEVQQGILGRVLQARPGQPALAELPPSSVDQTLVVDRMEQALRAMHEACAAKSVPLVFGLAAHNYVGHGPFASRGEGTVGARYTRDALRGEVDAAAVEAAVEADPERADLWFARGHARMRSGDMAGAREAFATAVDLDKAPMHLTSELAQRMRDVATEVGRPYLNLGEALATDAAAGLPDPALFLDHAHFTVRGHTLAAAFLADRFSSDGLIPGLPDGWRTGFEAAATAYCSERLDDTARLRAIADMFFANATFHVLFGNFADALPRFTQAFANGSKGTFEADLDVAGKLLFVANALGGHLDEWDAMAPEARMERFRQSYEGLRAALNGGHLESHVEGLAAPSKRPR